MTEVTTFPAPELFPVEPAEGSWEFERGAFHAALPSLMATHQGRYVAVYEGRVIADGPEKKSVARQAYDRAGYVPIYVGLVSNRPEPPARMPSARSWRLAGGDPAR